MPKLFVDDITVGEGDGFAEVVVRLDAAASTPISVAYASSNESAGGGDYVYPSGSLAFAAGETSKTVRVQIRDDAAIESREMFAFILRNPVGASLGREAGVVTLVDNDTLGETPQLFVDDLLVDEKQGLATFVVRLGLQKGQSSSQPVTVHYATQDGSALAGQDYTASSGTLTFNPGQSVKSITVPLLDDAAAEGVERFALVLSGATHAQLADAVATAEIGLSDGAGSAQPRIAVADATVGESDGFVDVAVRLHAPSTSTVSVQYASSNATAGGGDYIYPSGTLEFAPGETVKSVRVQIADDLNAEARESFFMVLRNASNGLISKATGEVVIVDNDTVVDQPQIFVDAVRVDEKQGTAQFVVRLGHQLGEVTNGTVTVDYATRDLSAQAGQDYLAASGSLSFAPGQSVHTVSVDLIDDKLAEALERFELVLSNPVNAALGHGTALAEIGRSDGVGSAQPRIRIDDLTVGESDGYARLSVSLHAPSTSPITVDYTSSNATAGGGDYDYPGGTLYFAPGETTKTVQVQVYDDTAAEGRETFYVGLRNPTNATLGKAWAMVNVVDDDTVVDQPQIWVEDVVTDEKQGTASFVLRLGQVLGEATNGTITVDYSTRDGTALAGLDYVARSGTLSFVPGESTKTVVVDLLDDTLPETGERFGLVLSNPVNAALGDRAAVAEMGASDGTPGQPMVSVSGTRMGEADGYADVLVSLSRPSNSPVSVDYASSNATAGGGDYDYPAGTLVFEPGETLQRIRVQVYADTVAEATESFSMWLRNPVNATLGTNTAPVEIVDDDGARPLHSHGRSDDVYTIDSTAVDFIEAADGGFDIVRSSASFTLPANLEGLVLTGSAVSAIGNAGDNLLKGNAANNILDGQGGIDTAVFAGPMAGYTLGGAGAARTVSSPAEGSDSLQSIERLRFSDAVVAYDTAAGGNTYAAYALLNAAFNTAPDAQLLGRWTAYLDQLGGNAAGLAQALIDYYAPGVSNEALVAYLWSTVVGGPIGTADLAAFVGLIENGSYTQATLTELAAMHPLNTNEFAAIVGQAVMLDPAGFVMPGE